MNQTAITNNYVNDARKNAIEMYYSLQNYYETRKETIDISEQLDKINAKDLPKKGEDLEEFDADFDKEYNNVKEDFN
ncbi:lipoprotein [Staphylococcus aureus]|nr:lipoprotein [Staphylococcus aureus]